MAEYNLIDSGSVMYRNTQAYRLANGDIAYCGERNARNRMGGFVGYTPFYVRFTPSATGPTWLVISSRRVKHRPCGDGWEDVGVAADRRYPSKCGTNTRSYVNKKSSFPRSAAARFSTII